MTPASRCPVRIAYSYVTNAADNTLSAYSVDATTGALTVVGTPTATGTSPYAIVGLEAGFYTGVASTISPTSNIRLRRQRGQQ